MTAEEKKKIVDIIDGYRKNGMGVHNASEKYGIPASKYYLMRKQVYPEKAGPARPARKTGNRTPKPELVTIPQKESRDVKILIGNAEDIQSIMQRLGL